jgi:molybdate transport repressor ModE-like protein
LHALHHKPTDILNKFSLKFKIWLETDDQKGILGDGKWALLKTISQTNSLKEAMALHGLTYRKTWDNLNKIEDIFGFQIIERQRGGKEGGKTVLTKHGQAIVDAFDEFHEKYDAIIARALEDTLDKIKKEIS